MAIAAPPKCHCGAPLDWTAFRGARAAAGVHAAALTDATRRGALPPDASAMPTRPTTVATPTAAALAHAGVPPSRTCCRTTLMTTMDRSWDRLLASLSEYPETVHCLPRDGRPVGLLAVPNVAADPGRRHPRGPPTRPLAPPPSA